MPKDFLADFGITMSASYGFRLSREFSLVNPGSNLESFLKKAKVAKIKVSSILEGDTHLLRMARQNQTLLQKEQHWYWQKQLKPNCRDLLKYPRQFCDYHGTLCNNHRD